MSHCRTLHIDLLHAKAIVPLPCIATYLWVCNRVVGSVSWLDASRLFFFFYFFFWIARLVAMVRDSTAV